MSKYDCSKCIDFVHEQRRMCNIECVKACIGCGLDGIVGPCCIPSTQEKIDIVQKWSDEHPESHEKTILEDFKEKYPNYARSTVSDIPLVCADYLYKKPYGKCSNMDAGLCEKCWNRPLSEVEDHDI